MRGPLPVGQGENRHVIDSSALLAALLVEPGGDMVAEVLSSAVMSSVNTAETISKLIDRGLSPSQATHAVGIFRLQVEPFDAGQAIAVAGLRGPTSRLGLSLADRACIALAQQLKLPVMTADRIWSKLEIGVEIKLIR